MHTNEITASASAPLSGKMALFSALVSHSQIMTNPFSANTDTIPMVLNVAAEHERLVSLQIFG